FLDLRSTTVAIEWFGGYVKDWSFGGFWYHLTAAGLSQEFLVPALFAGVMAQMVLALLLLPALLFRPHPFLATIIGYTAAFIFGVNLIIDPLFSVLGLSSPRWLLAYTTGPLENRVILLAVQAVCASIYLAIMFSQRVRMWFSSLSRPEANDELKKALSEWRARPESARLICRVG